MSLLSKSMKVVFVVCMLLLRLMFSICGVTGRDVRFIEMLSVVEIKFHFTPANRIYPEPRAFLFLRSLVVLEQGRELSVA